MAFQHSTWNQDSFGQDPFTKELCHILFEQSQEGVLLMNGSGKIVAANEPAAQILGYCSEELSGISWESIVPWSQRPTMLSRFRSLLVGDSTSYVQAMIAKDGNSLWATLRLRRLSNQQILVYINQFTDIYRNQQNLIYPSSLIYENLEITSNAANVATFSGYSPDEPNFTLNILNSIPANDLQTLNQQLWRSLRYNHSFQCLFLYNHPSLGTRRLEVFYTPAPMQRSGFMWYGQVRDIQTNEELAISLRYIGYDSMIAQDATIRMDLECRIFYWDAMAELLYGYRANEVIGKDISIILPFPNDDSIPPVMYEEIQRFAYWEGERFHVKNNGQTFVAHERIDQVFDAGNTPIGYILKTYDANDYYRNEQGLREYLNESHRISRSGQDSPMVLFVYDVSRNEVVIQNENSYWDFSSIKKIYSLDEYFQLHEKNMSYADAQALRRLLSTSAPIQYQYQYHHPNLGVRWYELKAIPEILNGTEIIWYGSIDDISIYNHTNNLLQYQQIILQSVTDAIVITDVNHTVLTWNKGAERIFGWSDRETLGKQLDMFVDLSKNAQNPAFQAEEHITYEEWQNHKDGSEIFLMITRSLLTGTEENDFRHFIYVCRDLSYFKKSTLQLEYQANLLKNVTDAVFACDMNSIITDWNTGAERIYGWTAEEAIGSNISILTDSPDPDIKKDDFDRTLRPRVLERGHVRTEVNRVHRDGRKIGIVASISLLRDAHGKPVGFVNIGYDITKIRETQELQKRIEEQLQQAQRFASLGRMAKGIAHNFNNALTVIQGYSELIQGDFPPDHPIQHDLQQITVATQQAASMNRHLLEISRNSLLKPTLVKLNDLFDNFIPLAQRLLAKNIKFDYEIEPDLWPIYIDAAHLEQSLMNLVLNAQDAMPDGGTVRLVARNVPHDSDKHADLIHDSVEILVCDTGFGITDSIKPHVFEPFFTTKEVGQGVGLGLSLVYSTIQLSNGSVSVHDGPDGVGACFEILLPRSDGMEAYQELQIGK
jgi:PAS domain S-box-containing protein